ncbi:MAG: hypothetical protein ACYDC1_02180 [Limisphaerales bacterium]
MNQPNLDAHDAKLRDLLRASRPMSDLPPRFEEGVWRRIARSEIVVEGPGPTNWLDRFVELLLRPRLALTGLTAVVLLGCVAGVWSGREAAIESAQARYLAAVTPHP